MNKTFLWIALIGLIAMVRIGEANPEGRKPSPEQPCVAPVPERAQWTMAVQSIAPTMGLATRTATEHRVVKELRYSKVGAVWRIVVVWSDGRTEEHYRVGNENIEPTENGGAIVTGSYPSWPYYSHGFYGIEWIKPEYYAETANYKNAECFVYKSSSSIPPDAPESKAWIDTRTLLPVAVLMGGGVVRIQPQQWIFRTIGIARRLSGSMELAAKSGGSVQSPPHAVAARVSGRH